IRVDETQPRVVRWSVDTNRCILEAEHSAYLAMPSRVVHRRQFELIHSPLSLIITDTLKGAGSHLIESFLHFAPGVTVEIAGPQKAIARNVNGRYIISISAGAISLHDTSYSSSYGVRQRNKALRVAWNTMVPAAFQMVIQQDLMK
ncbi:MAG: heparinase II/III family protein, partial [Ignavibacteriales bacterium]|nr:heparinase II/III family protein [Ignavibacteriales bacterium]